MGDASKVAPVDELSLVLVAVFATLFLHERPTLREWAGILLVGDYGALRAAFPPAEPCCLFAYGWTLGFSTRGSVMLHHHRRFGVITV